MKLRFCTSDGYEIEAEAACIDNLQDVLDMGIKLLEKEKKEGIR